MDSTDFENSKQLNPGLLSPQLHPPSRPRHLVTLPSIRQLHPYMPPALLLRDQAIQAIGRRSPRIVHVVGAGGEPVDELSTNEGGSHAEQEPLNNSRRRRENLSCTECRRRKIKCDRIQPCSPCSSRGEQYKCEWKCGAPSEKNLGRDVDNLKTRYHELTDEVETLTDEVETLRDEVETLRDKVEKLEALVVEKYGTI